MRYTVIASDNFNRANETPVASPWVSDNITINLAGNSLVAGTLGSNCSARLTTVSAGKDAYTQATVGGTDEGVSVGVTVRHSSVAVTFYLYNGEATAQKLWKNIAGSFTELAMTATGIVPSDVIEVRAVGAGITGVQNGTILLTVSDSAITAGGQAGVYSASVTLFLDNFVAGDIFVFDDIKTGFMIPMLTGS